MVILVIFGIFLVIWVIFGYFWLFLFFFSLFLVNFGYFWLFLGHPVVQYKIHLNFDSLIIKVSHSTLSEEDTDQAFSVLELPSQAPLGG